MDYKKLLYFLMVADCGSFTKAAAQLRIAQPALSRQIALLEEEFGVELLSRMGRHVRPTDAGEVLLKHAREIQRAFQRADEDMQSRARSPKGLVRVGAPPSLSVLIVPTLIETIQKELPDVTLKFREGTSLFLERSILDFELDLALVADALSGKGIHGELLAEEDIMLVGRPSQLRKCIPANKDGPRIFTTWQISAMLQECRDPVGINTRKITEIDAFLTLKDLTIQGRAVMLAPIGAFHEALAARRVSALPVDGAKLQRPVILASSARPGGRAVDAVARILRSEVLRLQERGVFRALETEAAG